MPEIQNGGLYKVGDKFVDANGKEAKPQKSAESKQAATPAAPAPAAFDVEKATKEELVAEAARLKLEVKRADGKDTEPLVSDYQAAIRAAQG